MYCFDAANSIWAVGFSLVPDLSNPFNFCEMKFYYYVIQFSQPFGFTTQCGLYRRDFFDWQYLKSRLISEGTKNPILTFFREINEAEYISFTEAFKQP
jgi:hypothetical protein